MISARQTQTKDKDDVLAEAAALRDVAAYAIGEPISVSGFAIRALWE